MLIRNISLSFTIGMLLLFSTFLFWKQIPIYDLVKLNELIEEKQIPAGEENRLNEEIEKFEDEGKALDYISNSAYAGLLLFLISVSFIFISVHVVVDKLFLRKFYEKPSWVDAIRRAILMSITITILIYYRLVRAKLEESLAIILIVILIEVFISSYLKEDFNKIWSNLRKSKVVEIIKES